MSTPAIFDTAMAGLRSAQAGLLSTSQNVAGASVDGYVRRRPDVKVSALSPTSVEAGGSSFAVEGFQRFYDGLLQAQLLSQQGRTSYTDTLTLSVGTLDSVISDPTTAIATKLGEFFNAAGSLANDSSNSAFQQSFLGSAREATDRLRILSDELNRLANYAREGLSNVLNEANTLMPQLAAINGQIKGAFNPGFSYPSADLLDERDRIAEKLSKLLGTQTILNDDGSANILVGGLQLVDRDLSNVFTNSSGTTPVIAPSDVSALRLKAASPTWSTPKLLSLVSEQNSSITEGEAGGFIHLLKNFIPTIKNSVDLLSATLIRNTNTIRTQASQYTFEDNVSAAIPAPGSNVLTLQNNPNGAIVEGQRLYINGVDQEVRVTNINANSVTVSGNVTVSLTDKVGFKLPTLSVIDPVFGYMSQDSATSFISDPSQLDRLFNRDEGYRVSKTRDAAINLNADSFAVSAQVDDISGLRIYVRDDSSGALIDTSRTVQSVVGTVVTASGAMTLPVGTSLSNAGVTVEFIPQSIALSVADHPSSGDLKTIRLPDSPNLNIDVTGARLQSNDGNGWQDVGRIVYRDGPLLIYAAKAGVTVSQGDDIRFLRDHSFSEVLDRLNPKSTAYEVRREQEVKKFDASLFTVLANGSADFFAKLDSGAARKIEAFRQEAAKSTGVVVMAVANTIAAWRAEGEANGTLTKILTNQKESVSGVNLDEEAANLIKYQQLYSAASKLIQAGRQMFDTLLTALIT